MANCHIERKLDIHTCDLIVVTVSFSFSFTIFLDCKLLYYFFSIDLSIGFYFSIMILSKATEKGVRESFHYYILLLNARQFSSNLGYRPFILKKKNKLCTQAQLKIK